MSVSGPPGERVEEGVPTMLERILVSAREDLERRKRELPLIELKRREIPAPGERIPGRRPFRDAIVGPGIGVIAEFKRRSPSAGALREQPSVSEIVSAYARGGARALSILTDGPHFGGSLEDIREARAACELPILRKDFIIDPYQLYEAFYAGADAVLLIVAALDQRTLRVLDALARGIGFEVLVEVHDRLELGRAIEMGAKLIGINNRDLHDFSCDVERTFALLEEVPAGVTVISESGLSTSAQLRRLHERGVGGVLIGETLMRASDPEAALREMLQKPG